MAVADRAARPTTPELAPRYKKRRKLASKSMGSGFGASRAWADLEALESELRRIDPDGEWRLESKNLDTGRWQVSL